MLHQSRPELFGAVVQRMLSADFNRLINKEVHFEGGSQLGFLCCTHLDNGMEEGQHIDERTIGRVGAGLETILTYFNVSGAYIQLQSIGWLRDHCGENMTI